MEFQDKSVLVTGAGSGFGAAIAEAFGRKGAKVVVSDLRLEAAREVADRIERAGGRGVAVQADVTDESSMRRLREIAMAEVGVLDVIVNNAGATQPLGPAEALSEAELDRLLNVNIKGLYWSVVTFTGDLKSRGKGVVLNIASVGVNHPRPGLAWYNATKGAVATLTRALALELAPHKIRVCAINPAAAYTPLLRETLGRNDNEATLRQFASAIPLGRLCDPADVAAAATFLASDDAGFVTGVCLDVDGGRSL